MPARSLTSAQCRELDRRATLDYGIASLMLMENAGRGVADCLCGLAIAGPVVVCCGGGNNGGDGFVIARQLALRGHQVRVLLFADPKKLSGDALTNYQLLLTCGIELTHIAAPAVEIPLMPAAWIVDALLGTGARGAPRAPVSTAIDQINHSGVPVLAVDLPSGLDADTGVASEHTIRAAHTCTFVAPKPGLLMPEASAYVGQLHVVDIGAPRKLVEGMLGQE